jgi:hypothetical protein
MDLNDLLNKYRCDLLYFIDFVSYKKFHWKWFHRKVANRLMDLTNGIGKKKVMIFMPPQVGKSTLLTYWLAWHFGKYLQDRVLLGSYAQSLASEKNIEIQKIMGSDYYRLLFPESHIVPNRGRMNSRQFDIPGHKDSLFAFGLTTGVAGRSGDLICLDDIIKSVIEAENKHQRDKSDTVYANEIKTRRNINTREVFVITRRHEDDLAARILIKEPDEWDVILIPAERVDDSDPDDTRGIGDMLFPEWQDPKDWEQIRKDYPRLWQCLYQQRPTKSDGNIINTSNFEYFHSVAPNQFIFTRLYVDTATSNDTSKDPTGILTVGFDNKDIYLLGFKRGWYSPSEIVDEVRLSARLANTKDIRVENKTMGPAVINALELDGYNVKKIDVPNVSKQDRTKQMTYYYEQNRIKIVTHQDDIDGKRLWSDEGLDKFITALMEFPVGSHDEEADVLEMATRDLIHNGKSWVPNLSDIA